VTIEIIVKMGTEIQFYKMKMWRWMVVTVTHHYELYWCHWIVHMNVVEMINFVAYHNRNCFQNVPASSALNSASM
jgi:hypothetical protein